MAPTIEQLEAMSDAEVRAQYNEAAKNTGLGLQWWHELMRRAVNRQTDTLIRLTWVIAFFGVVSTVGVLLTLFK
jgi:hypothetical protein